METLLWYLEITLDYIKQMLPCMVLGRWAFWLCCPTGERACTAGG